MSNQPDPNVRHDVGGWISGPSLPAPAESQRNQPHGMTPEEATALGNLRRVWDTYYGIALSDDAWKAHRLGSGAPWNITADTSGELAALIWDDYNAWRTQAGDS